MSESTKQPEPEAGRGYHLRPSRVLRKIRNGEPVSCFKINLADPRVVEIAAAAGFDCIWLCREHVPSDYLMLENMVRAAKAYDVDAMLRVSRGSYSDYITGLEMDAAGLMIPHVMSLQDAREAVRMTKFPPVGRRAVDGGNTDALYARVPLVEYLETANRERFVIYQIEDPEPLEEVEAIAALPGVDGLFFGPGDFSVAIGKPGEFAAPEVLEARRRVLSAARAAGKMAGAPATPETLRELLHLGANFLSIGADVLGLNQYVDELLGAIEAAVGESRKETGQA